jgi:HD-GYP domain-containing protein (c-di-GMP phosphodiesterase class II)
LFNFSSKKPTLPHVKKPESINTLRLLEPLNVLDSYIQELQGCDQARKQLRLLLKAIGEGIKADAVFVLSNSADDVFEWTGKQALNPNWCRNFIQDLLRETPGVDTQLVRSHLTRPGEPGANGPNSVAMVQISRSRQTWAVALSFTPGRRFHLIDIKLMALARRLLVTHSRQVRATKKLRDILFGLIHCLTAAIDAKDPYTCGHSERVARMAVRIAQQMSFSEGDISDLYLAGLLHDVGKIGIKDSVLQKQGRLTDEEMLHVQEHPVIGDRIISNVTHLAHLRPGVRSHHERWDGQGYPDRLAGEAIPEMARILAVADSCDAMMFARPYRPAMAPPQIEEVMTRGAGTQWDPRIVDHFMRCRQEVFSICQRDLGDFVHRAVDHAVASQTETSSKRSIGALPRDEFDSPGPLL